VRRIIFAAYVIAMLSSPSIAETPYENAARMDMEQLASSILAASLCKGAQFHGDALIASAAKGREAWCSATIKSAKQRNSDLLTEEKDTIDVK